MPVARLAILGPRRPRRRRPGDAAAARLPNPCARRMDRGARRQRVSGSRRTPRLRLESADSMIVAFRFLWMSCIVVAALAAGCGRTEAFVRVSDGPAGSFETTLMPIAGELVVAWYDTRDGHGEIYARRLDANGHPTGS